MPELDTGNDAQGPAPATVFRVPVTKAKGEFVEIDTSTLPDEVYREALLQGLKVLANRGTSKITRAAFKSGDEFKAAALAKANEQVEAMKAGKIKLTGGKAKKASGAVMTEARRIAKALVKDAIKASGGKISHYESSVITAAANKLLEEDPSIIAKAEEELKRRESIKVGIDLTTLVKPSQKLIDKAEARKADAQLSAKQAGMVNKRAKGKGTSANA